MSNAAHSPTGNITDPGLGNATVKDMMEKMPPLDPEDLRIGGYLYYPWISSSLLLGVICLTCNFVTFNFYRSKRRETVSLMYTALSFCDMVTGVSALLNGAALISILTDVFLIHLVRCSAFFTSITSHTSVFYNTVVVVARTINMLFPFYKTRNDLLKICFGVYPLIWVVITIVDMWFTPTSKLDQNGLILIPLVGSRTLKLFFPGDLPRDHYYWTLTNVFGMGIPYMIPALITLACFTMQASVLLKKGAPNSANNTRITLTILYLTGVFFLCNSAYFTVAIVATVTKQRTFVMLMVCHFTGNILAYLNSALNPIILTVRGKDLASFAKKSLRSATRSMRLSQTVNVVENIMVREANPLETVDEGSDKVTGDRTDARFTDL